MSRAQLLYELQKVELEMSTLFRRQKKISAALGESPQLVNARQEAQKAEGRLTECRVQTRDLELEIAGLNERIETNEQRLYSGKVTSPKELSNLQEETASIKRWKEKREEGLLEAMVEYEDAEASLTEAKAVLAQTDENWGSDQQDLVVEQNRLQADLQELREQRASMKSRIPPEDFDTYRKLHKSKAGRPVAALKNGLCQGCQMSTPTTQIQQARSDEELVFCNNCGRILHLM